MPPSRNKHNKTHVDSHDGKLTKLGCCLEMSPSSTLLQAAAQATQRFCELLIVKRMRKSVASSKSDIQNKPPFALQFEPSWRHLGYSFSTEVADVFLI